MTFYTAHNLNNRSWNRNLNYNFCILHRRRSFAKKMKVGSIALVTVCTYIYANSGVRKCEQA